MTTGSKFTLKDIHEGLQKALMSGDTSQFDQECQDRYGVNAEQYVGALFNLHMENPTLTPDQAIDQLDSDRSSWTSGGSGIS